MRKRRLIKSKFYKYTPQHAAEDIQKIIEVKAQEAKQTIYYTPEAVETFIKGREAK